MEEVLDAIVTDTWKTPHEEGPKRQIANAVDMVVLYDLVALSANEHASDQVRAMAALKLEELRGWLTATPARNENERAQFFFASSQIVRFQKDPKQISVPPPAEPPDGPPIGMDED